MSNMDGWKIPEMNGHFEGNIIELNGDLYDVIALLLSWLGGLVLNRGSKSITDMSWASFSWISLDLEPVCSMFDNIRGYGNEHPDPVSVIEIRQEFCGCEARVVHFPRPAPRHGNPRLGTFKSHEHQIFSYIYILYII